MRWRCMPVRRRTYSAGSPTRSARASTGARRHLHHRSQRQLHERLRRAVQLLRVLSPGRLGRRLRAVVRRDLPEDRRDDCRRRQPVAVAGRAQSGHPAGLVRGSVSRGQGAISRVQAARVVAAGSDPHLTPVATARRRGDFAAGRRRARQHPRRRRRDPRRSRSQVAALLREGDRRRVARRHAARPSCRASARRRR